MSKLAVILFLNFVFLVAVESVPVSEASRHDLMLMEQKLNLTPEEKERSSNTTQRFMDFFVKLCQEDNVEESRMNVIESCQWKNLTDDYQPIKACEDKVFGEKSLDDLRKDFCKADLEERLSRRKLMKECILGVPVLKEKIEEMTKTWESLSDEDKKANFLNKKEEIISCMEDAFEGKAAE
jgi:hypothetical protein